MKSINLWQFILNQKNSKVLWFPTLRSSSHSPVPPNQKHSSHQFEKMASLLCVFFFDITIPLALFQIQRKTTIFRKQGIRKTEIGKETYRFLGNKTIFLKPPKRILSQGQFFTYSIFSILRKSDDEGRRQAHDPFLAQQSYPGQNFLVQIRQLDQDFYEDTISNYKPWQFNEHPCEKKRR